MKTNLVTRGGMEILQEEMRFLWHEERPDITQKVSWAASLGDRSENADYHYNKKKLREIDRRIHYLTKRLDEIRIVDYSPEQEGKVFFGAWVRLSDDDDNELFFRIVGPDEIYHNKKYISVDAPMARACLGKEDGDDVLVKTDVSQKTWIIEEIIYNYHSEKTEL